MRSVLRIPVTAHDRWEKKTPNGPHGCALCSAAAEPTMSETYYSPSDLPRFGEVGESRSDLFAAYQSWSAKVFAEGALTSRAKYLIALSVAHALQCPYCIDAHTQTARGAGASADEITEAIHVAAVIRGGATLVHGVQALDAMHRH
jgi:alkylhydroperoxidase/carboxymuconolactone decarboxylase family protein